MWNFLSQKTEVDPLIDNTQGAKIVRVNYKSNREGARVSVGDGVDTFRKSVVEFMKERKEKKKQLKEFRKKSKIVKEVPRAK